MAPASVLLLIILASHSSTAITLLSNAK